MHLLSWLFAVGNNTDGLCALLASVCGPCVYAVSLYGYHFTACSSSLSLSLCLCLSLFLHFSHRDKEHWEEVSKSPGQGSHQAVSCCSLLVIMLGYFLTREKKKDKKVAKPAGTTEPSISGPKAAVNVRATVMHSHVKPFPLPFLRMLNVTQ